MMAISHSLSFYDGVSTEPGFLSAFSVNTEALDSVVANFRNAVLVLGDEEGQDTVDNFEAVLPYSVDKQYKDSLQNNEEKDDMRLDLLGKKKASTDS
eukprot:TRINITY_DN16951_c0_g1_i1.p1 TRINITY_DN16951_c0_g1~~TRINITY_DN16951_c0_g1_i1.p1  ORF type:complete len:97 (+),score=14.82 TRINITY_DN16951_c0_g1_i1:64-354(+)